MIALAVSLICIILIFVLFILYIRANNKYILNLISIFEENQAIYRKIHMENLEELIIKFTKL